jgi:transcriptional regulator with XRE-family HTH domain
MNHLGNFFQDQRISSGLSLTQLAGTVGYLNLSKGANRIARFEREGRVTEDLLAGLAQALGIDLQTVKTLIDQDRQDYHLAWEDWVSQPMPMQMIVRFMAAVYGTVPLSEEITTPGQAEAFASEYAKKHGRKVCLAVSRRLSIWIDKDGQVYARTEATPDDLNVPIMRMRGIGRNFLLGLTGIDQRKDNPGG